MKFDKITGLPVELYGGAWEKPAGHLQGAAADDENNYMYLSFTDRLVKVDMHTGEIVGSVTGLLAGSIYGGGAHLGDLAFRDGKVYGSLEYKATEKFYIAVFDVAKITGMDIDYKTPGVLTTMYMEEVVKDYKDELNAGEHLNGHATLGHKHACSGIDGITFGPLPGDDSGKIYMTVAYGVYRHEERGDNDYQVILAYDPDAFEGAYFDQNNPHEIGPKLYKKLFVYTGNTSYGVQNLEYDRVTGDYWMVVYEGRKAQFDNRPMYIVDGKVAPQLQKLQLGNHPCYGDMEGECLTLKAAAGTLHEESGVWGIPQMPYTADKGFISLGNDYYYVADGHKEEDKEYGYMRLTKLDRTNYTFVDVE